MNNNIPMAERLRPMSLDDYIGQKHLVGESGIIRKMIDSGRINSFILWGLSGSWQDYPRKNNCENNGGFIFHAERRYIRSERREGSD